MRVNLNDEREAARCPTCGKPMWRSDAYLDSILQRRGFLFCSDSECAQPQIEKPLRTKEPSRG